MLGLQKGEVESLFNILPLIAFFLALAGILIIISARKKTPIADQDISIKSALLLGGVQGLCLPFRGLSRSGVTISTALLRGIPFYAAEEFSFALAVLLTPSVVFLELHRLIKANVERTQLIALISPGLIGMLFSFIAGLIALKWLSSWLEKGRWQWFGFYCMALAVVTLFLHFYL